VIEGEIIRVPFAGRSWSGGVCGEECLVFIILIWGSGLYRSRLLKFRRSILLFPVCICPDQARELFRVKIEKYLQGVEYVLVTQPFQGSHPLFDLIHHFVVAGAAGTPKACFEGSLGHVFGKIGPVWDEVGIVYSG